MRRTSFAGMHCSIAQTLDVVGEWWTPLILRDVYMGLHRKAVVLARRRGGRCRTEML